MKFKNKKVLYVEDDPLGRELTAMLLEESFFPNLDIASNGEEALEMFKKNSYDIVISDINMPKLSGIELFKEIKKINQKTILILISAYQEEIIDIEVDGFISKPLEYTSLKNIISKISQKI